MALEGAVALGQRVVTECAVAGTSFIERRFHRTEVHGKIGRFHLVRKIFPDVFLCPGSAANGDGISRNVCGSKERESSQVIPVGVREQQGDVRSGFVFDDRMSKLANPRARIDDDLLAGVRPDFDARRFSAVSKRLNSWCRQRSSAAPDFDIHGRILMMDGVGKKVGKGGRNCKASILGIEKQRSAGQRVSPQLQLWVPGSTR